MLTGRQRIVLNSGGESDIATGDHYYPSSAGKALSGSKLALQATITANTVTVEATLEQSKDNAALSATPTWIDITKTAVKLSTGVVGSANLTASDVLYFNDLRIDRYRVKVVRSNATNAIRLTALEGE